MKRTCELNSIDILELSTSDRVLEVRNCIYVGLKRLTSPVCFENEVEVDIQNDETSGICEINQKRVDIHWEPVEWANEQFYNLNTDTWSSVTYICDRENITERTAHGGKVMCNETTDINERSFVVAFVGNKTTYSKALQNCMKFYRGHLFGEVDGTRRQLANLRKGFAC